MSSEAQSKYNCALLITQLPPDFKGPDVLDVAIEENWFVLQRNFSGEKVSFYPDETFTYGRTETRPGRIPSRFSTLVVCTTIRPATWPELPGAALFDPDQERVPKALIHDGPLFTDLRIGQYDIVLSANPFDTQRFASWLGQAAILARCAESV